MVNAAVRRKFEALVAAAFSDGYLAESEKDVLQKKAGALGIPPRDVNDIFFLGQQRKLTIAVPSTSLERDALLEDLIEVVVSDGRVEAPEYHLLARFAETLKIPLPELRTRVNRRMQQGKAETRVEPRPTAVKPAPPRTPAAAPPPPPAPKRPEPQMPAAPAFEAPKLFAADALPPPPTSSISFESMIPKDPKVADLPPVTLQLLKQSIMFDTEADSISNIARTLGIQPSAAADIRAAIVAAFPELKPSQPLRPRR